MSEIIEGFEIYKNEKTPRIVNIDISENILNKLIFPFNKFDITALEYKPFTRFTIAKSLDDLSQNKLSFLLNKIIKDRKLGCFIIGPENQNTNIDDITNAIGADTRIGTKYLKAGLGFAGPCFPRDNKAISFIGESIMNSQSYKMAIVELFKRSYALIANSEKIKFFDVNQKLDF